MSTIHAVTSTERAFWRPSSRAQWAYAAGCAVLTVGLAAIAAPGVPSQHLGVGVVIAATLTFVAGGLIENDYRTVAASAVVGLVAGYVVIFSTEHRAYSHQTLAAQFLAVVLGSLAFVGLRSRSRSR